jgi:hypothetical protein
MGDKLFPKYMKYNLVKNKSRTFTKGNHTKTLKRNMNTCIDKSVQFYKSCVSCR